MKYYIQNENYGYEKSTEEGGATISFGNTARTEISQEEYYKGMQLRKDNFERICREREEDKKAENKEDYKALISAGIPHNTAKRLTKYYGAA